MLGGRRRPTRLPAGPARARVHPRGDRRLHPHMAKIRVHELAKKYNMPSSEVMAKLVAAGIEVKAAATAVDQTMADAALTGKKVKKPSENGARQAAAPARRRATWASATSAPARPRASSCARRPTCRARRPSRRRPRAATRARSARRRRRAPAARAAAPTGARPAPPCRASAPPARPAACAAW